MDKPMSPAPPVTAPHAGLPKGSINAHVHLVGDDFTLWENAVERPSPGTLEDWLTRFRAHQAALGCEGGVIVHSILYGGDNAITLQAVARMGAKYRAVCLIPDDASASDIKALADAGCKAVRLNYVHGGLLSWDGMKRLAPLLADHGLHVEMLAHSHLHLSELAPQIAGLPVEIVFDHCAWPDPRLGVTPGERALERLLAEGQVWVKLSAAYRYDPNPQDRFARFAAANPERLVWGSDWPHLMLGDATMPDTGTELDKLLSALPDPATRQRIFVENPRALYRLP